MINKSFSLSNSESCSLAILNEHVQRPVYYDSLAIFPLPIFYDEQKNIGNEEISYRMKLDPNKLASGTYEVRFYVYYKQNYFWITDRLWSRVTQDLVFVKEL